MAAAVVVAVVVREDNKCSLNKNPQCIVTNMLMSYANPIGSTNKVLVCRLKIIVCIYLKGTSIGIFVVVWIYRVCYSGNTLNAMDV